MNKNELEKLIGYLNRLNEFKNWINLQHFPVMKFAGLFGGLFLISFTIIIGITRLEKQIVFGSNLFFIFIATGILLIVIWFIDKKFWIWKLNKIFKT